jgi:hypothetical protein
MLTKKEMVDQLHEGIYNVTFTKVNGDNRVMPCTLMQEYMPPQDSTAKTVADDLDRISVWCTDANGWRAFKPSTVTSFERLS